MSVYDICTVLKIIKQKKKTVFPPLSLIKQYHNPQSPYAPLSVYPPPSSPGVISHLRFIFMLLRCLLHTPNTWGCTWLKKITIQLFLACIQMKLDYTYAFEIQPSEGLVQFIYFHCYIAFHCMAIPQFTNPFSSWPTYFSCFQVLLFCYEEHLSIDFAFQFKFSTHQKFIFLNDIRFKFNVLFCLWRINGLSTHYWLLYHIPSKVQCHLCPTSEYLVL